MVLLYVAALVVLGAVATVHLRVTSDDEIYGTPVQRRARTSPDGTDPRRAAAVRRDRRAARRLEIAGRRGIRHLGDGPPVRWRRRTARRRT